MKKKYFQIYIDLFQLIYIEKDIYDLAQNSNKMENWIIERKTFTKPLTSIYLTSLKSQSKLSNLQECVKCSCFSK